MKSKRWKNRRVDKGYLVFVYLPFDEKKMAFGCGERQRSCLRTLLPSSSDLPEFRSKVKTPRCSQLRTH